MRLINEIIKQLTNSKMKTITIFLISIAFAAVSAGADVREFTSADGSKTLKAKVLDYSQDKGVVKMLRVDGKVMTFPVNALSEKDGEYLKVWYQSTMAARKLEVRIKDEEKKTSEKKTSNARVSSYDSNFNLIVDGSDNFRTRFLINDYCLKNRKILVSGAISKFDGQVYTFNFSKKKSPCLRCFIPNAPPTEHDIDNCEYEGVLGTLGGIIGSIQANEVVKEILGIGETLCGYILIIDGLKLTFRKVKLNKRSDCFCNEKKK